VLSKVIYSLIAAIAVVGLGLSIPLSSPPNSPTPAPPPTPAATVSPAEIQAAWVWEGTPLTPKLLEQARSQGFKTIYLDINRAIDFLETGNSAGLAALESEIATISAQAKSHNITLQALIGSPAWSASDHWYILENLTTWVLDLNSRSLIFSGIHFDLEPHTLPDYDQNKQTYQAEYLVILESLITRSKPYRETHPDFVFAWDLPIQDDPSFTDAILTRLDRVPASHLILMAYRTKIDTVIA